MSFRENLQHLRATRNMTQEQLAMLLGVSRQSVTKWEAEKSYPEMDKLLKLCQIFECSLDDLVQGDLTDRPGVHPDAPGIPKGPAVDVYGYDELWRKMAFRMPCGVSAVIAGVSLCAMLNGTLSGALRGGAQSALPVMLMFACVAVGLAFLVPAGMEITAFNRAHPFIEDFYTQADRDQARQALSRAVVVGVAIVLLGLAVPLTADDTAFEHAAGGIFLLLVAVAVWIFVHWGMLYYRVDVSRRNENVASEMEETDLIDAEVSEQVRASMRALRGGKKTRKQQLISQVSGIIMIVATMVGMVLLFGPVLASPNPDTFDPAGTPTAFFWLAWPIGGMLCGIATIVIEMFYRER